MGFLSGRVTFARFRVGGRPPRMFGPEHLESLAAHAVGKQRVADKDGIQVGWTGGDHVLDTKFDLAKNIVNDALCFGFRIDQEKLPSDLLRAYTAIELAALATGKPSGRQKREARENARERLEAEAKDGRFIRRKVIDLFWDAPSNELLVGSTSVSMLDRLLPHFERTFERKLAPITSGNLAFSLAEAREQTRGVDDASPTAFVPGGSSEEYAWLPDEASRDFVGNEFLLWLWYTLDHETDTIALSDGSEVVGMLARTLTLECPRGQTGRETITSEGPSKLPEAKRAVQAGKLPRKCGLTLVRHDLTYELALHAETLAVASAKLPPPAEEEDRARLEERVTRIRHLIESLDLLYDAFGQRRFSETWSKELGKMRKWLARGEPATVSA